MYYVFIIHFIEIGDSIVNWIQLCSEFILSLLFVNCTVTKWRGEAPQSKIETSAWWVWQRKNSNWMLQEHTAIVIYVALKSNFEILNCRSQASAEIRPVYASTLWSWRPTQGNGTGRSWKGHDLRSHEDLSPSQGIFIQWSPHKFFVECFES